MREAWAAENNSVWQSPTASQPQAQARNSKPGGPGNCAGRLLGRPILPVPDLCRDTAVCLCEAGVEPGELPLCTASCLASSYLFRGLGWWSGERGGGGGGGGGPPSSPAQRSQHQCITAPPVGRLYRYWINQVEIDRFILPITAIVHTNHDDDNS